MTRKLCCYRLDANSIQLIQDLKQALDFSTDVEVVRRSLRLLSEVQKNQAAGGELVIRHPDGTSKSLVFI